MRKLPHGVYKPATPLQLVRTEEASWMRGETSSRNLATTQQLELPGPGWLRTFIGMSQDASTEAADKNIRSVWSIDRIHTPAIFCCSASFQHKSYKGQWNGDDMSVLEHSSITSSQHLSFPPWSLVWKWLPCEYSLNEGTDETTSNSVWWQPQLYCGPGTWNYTHPGRWKTRKRQSSNKSRRLLL